MGKSFYINKPWSIALTYLVLGIFWILFSDSVAETLVSDDIRQMSTYQSIKGVFFVVITALLIYILINRLYSRVKRRNIDLELLFKNPDLGILKLDESGNIKSISENIFKMTGFKSEELIGKHILEFFPKELQEESFEDLMEIASSKENKSFQLTKQIISKNGDTIIIKAYGMKVLNEKSKKHTFIAAFQNISEQINFLNSLESQNKKLRELAFEQSHIVRAPLARILGIADLINGFELDNEEKKDLLTHINTSAKELDQALRDINSKMSTDL